MEGFNMLSKEQLNKLKEEVEAGELAKQILEEHDNLKLKIEALERWLEDWDEEISTSNIKQINFGTGGTNKQIYTEDKKFAGEHIKKIVEHELEVYKERINKISI